jgi:hypothetical protein
MAQFMVAAKEYAKFAPVIAAVYQENSIKLWDGVWLVSDDTATAQQVAIKLNGTAEGNLGTVIITSINGYYGYAPKNVWEWLAVKGTPRHGTST